jgi:hypothetical protein
MGMISPVATACTRWRARAASSLLGRQLHEAARRDPGFHEFARERGHQRVDGDAIVINDRRKPVRINSIEHDASFCRKLDNLMPPARPQGWIRKNRANFHAMKGCVIARERSMDERPGFPLWLAKRALAPAVASKRKASP